MRRVSITFRELLERILPLDQLSPADLARVRDALAEGHPGELERLAFYHLERLASAGRLRALPERQEGGERVLRFQLADSLAALTLRLPSPALPSGLVAYPRALVTARGTAPAEKLRLLAADQGLIGEDNRLPRGRAELIGVYLRATHDVVGSDSAAFFPVSPSGEQAAAYAPPPEESPLLEPWLAATVLEKDLMLVCPDLAACEALAGEAGRGFRSVAAVRIHSKAAGVSGALEARAHAPGFFDSERLSLLSLLGESFEAGLTQAARLERLVFVDPLTGVYNRSFFQREIASEVARARRESKPMALCLADIDDFKRFNSDYGYEAGNQVLTEVARLLKRGLRPFDSVARWGGEEFAILLAAPVGAEEAQMIGERLRRSIEESEVFLTGLDRREHRAKVTASMGIALFPSDADTPDDLWRRANQALLQAKRPPKNRITLFSELGD